jgi:hypothetical protein
LVGLKVNNVLFFAALLAYLGSSRECFIYGSLSVRFRKAQKAKVKCFLEGLRFFCATKHLLVQICLRYIWRDKRLAGSIL